MEALRGKESKRLLYEGFSELTGLQSLVVAGNQSHSRRNRPKPLTHFTRLIHACSDSSVGVEHHTEGASNSTRRQVTGESRLNHTCDAVGAAHLAPDGLVVGTFLFVLSFVDEGDTLSVVEK